MATCRALLKGGSRTFHAASKVLPRRVADPAIALYAFCRLADDAVDLGNDRAAAVARLRERLDRAYRGQPMDMAADRVFADVVAKFCIPRQLPEALLEGLAWDAEVRRYETLHDLTAYAARVAGTVGAMMTLVMGQRSPEIVARACDLGVAMQLTNIARDVGEDARAGRLYLPLSWLREAGIDPDAWLANPVVYPRDRGDRAAAAGCRGYPCTPARRSASPTCRPAAGPASMRRGRCMPRSAANWSAAGWIRSRSARWSRPIASSRCWRGCWFLLETEWAPAKKLGDRSPNSRKPVFWSMPSRQRRCARRAEKSGTADRGSRGLGHRSVRTAGAPRSVAAHGFVPIGAIAMSDTVTINDDATSLAEQHRAEAKVWFESLRDRICAEVELLEREAPADLFPGEPATFTYKPWKRATGSGGGTGGFLSDGRLFEKIGIHTSSANGKLTPEMAKTLPGDGKQLDYVSTSISLIMHPRSPRVPTVHMNTRFLSTAQGWFGGGADLTPMLPEQRQPGCAGRRDVSRRDAARLRRARSGLLRQIQGMGRYLFLPAASRPGARRRRHFLRSSQHRGLRRRILPSRAMSDWPCSMSIRGSCGSG